MSFASPELRQRLREYYNSSAPYLREMHGHGSQYFATYIELVARYAPNVTGREQRLLDLGCSSGASTALIAAALPGYDCTGLDLAAPAIARAAAVHGRPRLHFGCGDCLELPFADATFAVVASCDMIEHVPDPERALCEMARVTRQGGIVVVKAPHHRNPLLPLADLLCLRARYPLTRRWHENVPRLAEVVLEFWRKARSPHAQFRTRDPDLSDVVQVGEDADAVYEVCVFDLIAFFRKHGFSILNVAAPRRHKPSSQLYTRLFPYFASVGIVAQKSAPRA